MDVLGDLSLHVEGLRVSMMRHRRRCAILLLTSLEKRSLERSIFAYDSSKIYPSTSASSQTDCVFLSTPPPSLTAALRSKRLHPHTLRPPTSPPDDGAPIPQRSRIAPPRKPIPTTTPLAQLHCIQAAEPGHTPCHPAPDEAAATLLPAVRGNGYPDSARRATSASASASASAPI